MASLRIGRQSDLAGVAADEVEEERADLEIPAPGEIREVVVEHQDDGGAAVGWRFEDGSAVIGSLVSGRFINRGAIGRGAIGRGAGGRGAIGRANGGRGAQGRDAEGGSPRGGLPALGRVGSIGWGGIGFLPGEVGCVAVVGEDRIDGIQHAGVFRAKRSVLILGG